MVTATALEKLRIYC